MSQIDLLQLPAPKKTYREAVRTVNPEAIEHGTSELIKPVLLTGIRIAALAGIGWSMQDEKDFIIQNTQLSGFSRARLRQEQERAPNRTQTVGDGYGLIHCISVDPILAHRLNLETNAGASKEITPVSNYFHSVI